MGWCCRCYQFDPDAKGLSAQNLATPSIGGSMNIVTDAAALGERGSFKQEVGAWGFLKSTISYNTGLLMDDKLASKCFSGAQNW